MRIKNRFPSTRKRGRQMADRLQISVTRLVPAPADLAASGVLGFVTLEIGGLVVVEQLVVKRGLRKPYVLSFPARDDRHGNRHFTVRPLNDAARLEIERVVFEAWQLIEEEHHV